MFLRILYDSKKSEYKSPFGALHVGELCSLCLKIPVSCETYEVKILFENDHTGDKHSVSANLISEDGLYETYGCEFSLPLSGLYFYHFKIFTKGSDFELFRQGYDLTNIGVGERWQITCFEKDFFVPEIFKGKVMYQIFPDRFYMEELENAQGKLAPFYVHENKDDIPDFRPDENGKVLNCDFFGGNLKGITKKIDYIKSLGVSIIYLNPIFMAYSNHRYDTCDYKRIDPLLGDEKDFENLCAVAHSKGMKIILDGVFSHTGSRSIYFDKEGEFGGGAFWDSESKYRDWFRFGKNKNEYESWWGIETLPCVDEMCPGFVDYIISSSESVISHWMKKGADGFRLDVADELPDEFIKLLRKRVKEIKKESFVIGEVWEDASNKISYGVRRKYFTHSELDSVMNYVYKNAIIDYVTKRKNGIEFEREIMTIAENYPPGCLHSLMNSLSTHDTSRIITALSDADESMTKEEKSTFKMDKKMRARAKDSLYVAVFLQYFLPGTACIYYGDEIGMEGFGDPFSRGYFRWDETNNEICEFFREMGKIKNSHSALQKGTIGFSHSGDVLIMERISDDEKLIGIVNMSDDEYRSETDSPIICHKVSIRGKSLHIQKGGFVLYCK